MKYECKAFFHNSSVIIHNCLTDWEALQEGSAARLDETLKMAMEVNLHNLRTSMAKHTLSALAWMVADGILDFKLAPGKFDDKLEYSLL